MKPKLLASVIFPIIVSLMLSVADYRIVDAEKRVASDIKNAFPAQPVYYAGRLGYHYYMHKAGFIYYDGDTGNLKKDALAAKNVLGGDDAPLIEANRPRLSPVKRFSYALFPLSTIGGRAGFYGYDRLPYAWIGIAPMRVFLVYEYRNTAAMK